MSAVKVRRISLGNAHDDSKWVVLEAYVDGIPAVTKRGTISTAGLATGKVTIQQEKERLISTVEEYLIRYGAAQEALKEL